MPLYLNPANFAPANIDSATSHITTQAGNFATPTWVPVVGLNVVVPAGVPYCFDLVMPFGWAPGTATVGTGLGFYTQIRRSDGTPVNQIAPYGQGGTSNVSTDEYYVVPVVGQNQFRTHVEHWEMQPLSATDNFYVVIATTVSGTSAAYSMPAFGVGGPVVFTARRS